MCIILNTKNGVVILKILIANLESCGTNYQTDYLIDELYQHFEFTKDMKQADIILMLGGCCCTEANLSSTISFINYILKNKMRHTKTYLIGCITRGFKNIPQLQQIENQLKDNIDYIFDHYEPNQLLKHICKHRFEDLIGDSYGTCNYNEEIADIYIQNGCLHSCSFCKTNYLNCSLKDAPLEKVKEVIDYLNEEKVKVIQLRGLNLSQYGLDLYHDYKLMDLCEYIETKSNIKQVILANFAFSDAIRANFAARLKYLEKPSIINGSLESGSNRILELMNKGFTQEEFLAFFEKITSVYKKTFHLNIISGFPTETIDDCLETLSVLKQVNPEIVNINTYLDSEFIPSHNLEQLSSSDLRLHPKIYSKILKNNSIEYKINGAN